MNDPVRIWWTTPPFGSVHGWLAVQPNAKGSNDTAPMPTRSKTSIATEYEADAKREWSIVRRLEAEGKSEGAMHHRSAARHFQEKADLAKTYPTTAQFSHGEVKDSDGIVAWHPKNTLRVPDQVALDASADRKELLVGKHVDVAALALDVAASIKADNALEKMLSHQLALCHRATFEVMDEALGRQDSVEKARLLNAATRLMSTFQNGLLVLQRLRSGGNQVVTVQHVSVQGGQTVIGNVHAGGVGPTDGRGGETK